MCCSISPSASEQPRLPVGRKAVAAILTAAMLVLAAACGESGPHKINVHNALGTVVNVTVNDGVTGGDIDPGADATYTLPKGTHLVRVVVSSSGGVGSRYELHFGVFDTSPVNITVGDSSP